MSVAIRIIPCLDVKDGRVVKGVNFQGLKDAGDPATALRGPMRSPSSMSRPPTKDGPPCWTWSAALPNRSSCP